MYIETFQKYEFQAEICSRNKMYEEYCDSLLSQAELLTEYINNPKKAKSFLDEAIAMAEVNNLNDMVLEVKRMLKEIK